jgi:hypothetical protein
MRPSLSIERPRERERSTSESMVSSESDATSNSPRPSWARKRRLVGQGEEDSSEPGTCQRPCLAFLRPSILDSKFTFARVKGAQRPRAMSGPCWGSSWESNTQIVERPSLDLSVSPRADCEVKRGKEHSVIEDGATENSATENTATENTAGENQNSSRSQRPCLAFMRPSVLDGKFSFAKTNSRKRSCYKRAKSSPRWHCWGSTKSAPQLSAERPSLDPVAVSGEERTSFNEETQPRNSDSTMSESSDTEPCIA